MPRAPGQALRGSATAQGAQEDALSRSAGAEGMLLFGRGTVSRQEEEQPLCKGCCVSGRQGPGRAWGAAGNSGP